MKKYPAMQPVPGQFGDQRTNAIDQHRARVGRIEDVERQPVAGRLGVDDGFFGRAGSLVEFLFFSAGRVRVESQRLDDQFGDVRAALGMHVQFVGARAASPGI